MKTQDLPCAPNRVRYFTGQLLTAEDFEAEQEYLREKRRRHNRYSHGYGVVNGLQVSIGDNNVRVDPGLAVDCHGEEIVVCEPTEVALTEKDGVKYLTICYIERETDPVPVPGSEETIQNSRIEEVFELTFECDHPCSGHKRDKLRWVPCGEAHGIPLAKLTYRRGHWRIDRKFRRPCSR